MAVIKGTETIAQYKIAKWVNENFEDGFITIEFTSSNTAILIDSQNMTMNVKYDKEQDKIIVE